MTSAVGTPAQTARQAPNAHSGATCPECSERFTPAHPRAIFCSRAHKRVWEARTTTRGRQLTPFAIVARITRGGTRGDKSTGTRALVDQDQLLQRWRDEDAAAGRMSAVDYLAIRYRLGYDRP